MLGLRKTKLQGGRSMSRIPQSCSPVNARREFEAVLLEAEATLRRTIEVRLTALLMAVVRHVVGRRYHRCRKKVSRRLRGEGRCSRCGSSASQRFTRNGFRERHLLTLWGAITIYLPRVRCVCGGSVRVNFGGLLRPYQRISSEVDAQIHRWGAPGLACRRGLHASRWCGIAAHRVSPRQLPVV